MPEIVEVKNYADFIKKMTKNKEIKKIKILNGRYFNHDPFDGYDALVKMLPIVVTNVTTKGKLICIHLENDYYILSTLGLSGGWCFYDKHKSLKLSKVYDDYLKHSDTKQVKEYIKKSLNHLNVEFEFSTGSLYNYDVLSYGTLRVIKGYENVKNILNKIGPDIMDELTNYELFKSKLLKKEHKKIGIVLMDQKLISGIGNYLRADVLYLSKISPFRLVSGLSEKELKLIFFNCKMLTWSDYNMKKCIELNYCTSTTKIPSDYNRLFFIYREEKDIYGNKVLKKELYEGSQKRFIYYVPSIQK